MSEIGASEPVERTNDAFVEDALGHRKRVSRQVRHRSRTELHVLAGDNEGLEDADLLPAAPHDLGRKSSPPPHRAPKPGRRSGFKVWKTPFWKRRRSLWAERNAATRRLVEAE